jgi:hypothetical protein
MLKAPRRSPVETPLLFEIDPQPAEDLLTSMAGLTLVSEAFRGLGLGQSANRHLQIKERQRGLDEGTYLESFVLLNAAGGECVAGESADQRSATLVPGTSTFPVDRRPTGSWPRLLPTSRLVSGACRHGA